MVVVIKVVNGKIQEYENGNYKRTYGSNIVAADTDGHIVAAVTAKGKVEEYKNVSFKRSLSFKLNSIKNHLEI
ncbi:IceA2 protein [Helicobacter pylori]|uniref:IceA2 protein n=1 Tax=Helicobacter pylori TaxID=210 RepID=UPI0018D17938|nr:IceA2 protein [Helicobacter pylori]MBH0277070.1 IceA2 protein [Helicobacter pylori]